MFFFYAFGHLKTEVPYNQSNFWFSDKFSDYLTHQNLSRIH